MMRSYGSALIVIIVLGTSPAFAAGERCPSISDNKERLACFDREMKPTPPAKQKPIASKAGDKENTGKYVDQMQVENDRVTRRLKGICRGC